MGSTPSGINLSAAPPRTGMSNRRALLVVLGAIFILALIIGVGIWHRSEMQKLQAKAYQDQVPYSHTHGDSFADSLMPPKETPTTPAPAAPPPAPPATHTAPAAPRVPHVSATEQARIEAWQEEQKARKTPLAASVNSAFSPMGQGNGVGQNSAAQGVGKPLPGGASDLKPPGDTLPYMRVPAPGKYVIPAGTWIPATLEPQANSDLPGTLVARITENLYDNREGRRILLIPQGAELIGSYDNRVSYGQGRLFQFWNRIMFEDFSSLRIDGMEGEDINGASGLKDRVNNHYGRLVRDAALVTVFAVGIGLTQRQAQTQYGYPTVGGEISQQVGAQLSTIGSQFMTRNGNRQPTIEIRSGTKFFVLVKRDILFAEPYKPYPVDYVPVPSSK